MATVLRDSAVRLATYQRQGAAVLLADLRGLGETTDPVAFNDPKYYNQEYRVALLSLHLGRSLPGQRVRDVQTLLWVIRHEQSWQGLPLTVRADGRASLAALQAAILSPQIERVQVSGGPSSFQYFLENPAAKEAYSEVVPGALRTYDVPDLRRALGNRLIP
jgi:hypothetical protein